MDVIPHSAESPDLVERQVPHIALAYPTLPPAMDGIAAYTARLAEALAQQCRVTVLTGAPGEAGFEPIPGVDQRPAFSSFGRGVRGLANALDSDVRAPDWLLLQYNPACYSWRFKFNPYLIATLRKIRRRRRTRVGLVLHEAYAGQNDSLYEQAWQRAQLGLMCREADLAASTIASWGVSLRRRFPNLSVEHIPVGSNITQHGANRAQSRARYEIDPSTVVLGLFSFHAGSKLALHVREACERIAASGLEVVVLSVGASGVRTRDIVRPLRLIETGPLPEPDVSTALNGVDILMAPYRYGVSTRRGSFVAGLAHGLPTVTTLGAHTDPVLLEEENHAFLGTPEEEVDAFASAVLALALDPERRVRMAPAARALHNRTFDWAVIAERFLQSMRVEDVCSVQQPFTPSAVAR